MFVSQVGYTLVVWLQLRSNSYSATESRFMHLHISKMYNTFLCSRIQWHDSPWYSSHFWSPNCKHCILSVWNLYFQWHFSTIKHGMTVETMPKNRYITASLWRATCYQRNGTFYQFSYWRHKGKCSSKQTSSD